MSEGPRPGLTSFVSAEAARTRVALVDARIAIRRWLERLRWARILIAAAAQIVITLVAWRIWVWRAQRRRR